MLFKTFFLFTLMFAAVNLFAQSGASVQLEIQNLERAVSTHGIPAVERHAALVRLAQLRQLSGDIEGAARNWLEAATAIPGSVDDDALLACAYCLAAMGEWERAIIALEPLVSRNIRARFLDIAVRAIKTGDTSMLGAIAFSPEYLDIRSEILFLLWKISYGEAAERWRVRLVTDFPHSPEGRLASSQTSSSINLNPSPFWFFIGAPDTMTVLAGAPHSPPPAVTAPAAQVPAPAPVAAFAPTTARLQAGIFSREANARSHAAGLRNAGFFPSIERRVVNNNEMWAVTVPAGADSNRTIADLRSAGFEAFVIR